jgi:hypothetical protein
VIQDGRDRAQPKTSKDLSIRFGLLLLSGAVAVVAVVMALRTVAHANEPVYDLPAIAVVTVCVATAVVVGGAIAMARSRQPHLALLSALSMLLFVVGVLAILSIGILLLIAAVAVLVVLVHQSRANLDRAAVLGGAVSSFGLVAVLVVSLQPPIVECLDSGVRTTSRAWWGGSGAGSGSGTASFDPDSNTASGTITVGSSVYSYTCRDGRLSTFSKQLALQRTSVPNPDRSFGPLPRT